MLNPFRAAHSSLKSALEPDPASTVIANPNDPKNLLEALVCETHEMALHVAMVTSSMNALGQVKDEHAATDIAHYVPRPPQILIAFQNSYMERKFDARPVEIVSEFFETAASALTLIEDYLSEAGEIGHDRAAVLHADRLRRNWREVCAEAGQMLARLDTASENGLPVVYAANTRALQGLLAAARAGKSPCLDENGRATPPPLPQRRHAPRRGLFQNCAVHNQGAALPAFAKDVSIGGLGLTRVEQLTPDEHVKVELASGRVLEGRVAWSMNACAGIEFHRPLAPDDPLIAG